MNGCTDLDINCYVRKVLVRHWIDLGRVSMRTTRGVVRLSGELRTLRNPKDELSTALILTILTEIRRIKNVRRITTDFINWVYKDGMWQEPSTGTPIPQTAPTAPASAEPEVNRVYEIEDEELSADTPQQN